MGLSKTSINLLNFTLFFFNLNFLEIKYNTYFKTPYPPQETLKELSEKLQIDKNKIRFWFKNRRIKDFKMNKLFSQKFKVIFTGL